MSRKKKATPEVEVQESVASGVAPIETAPVTVSYDFVPQPQTTGVWTSAVNPASVIEPPAPESKEILTVEPEKPVTPPEWVSQIPFEGSEELCTEARKALLGRYSTDREFRIWMDCIYKAYEYPEALTVEVVGGNDGNYYQASFQAGISSREMIDIINSMMSFEAKVEKMKPKPAPKPAEVGKPKANPVLAIMMDAALSGKPKKLPRIQDF